jgi:hypothetical protein
MDPLLSAPPPAAAEGRPLPVSRATLLVVLVLWAAYTAVQTMLVLGHLDEAISTVVGLLLGVVALRWLGHQGWSRADRFLRFGRLSWPGALALGWLVVLWPFVLATGEWVGWDPGRAALQGLGGVSQELFFRAALLPVLLVWLGGRRWPALLGHTLLFTIWHAGALLVTPPEMLGGAVAILVVSFLAGLAWGWQTLHDRTIVWVLVHHALLWIVGSMFLLAPPD